MFKARLLNMGVQFSMAVHEKRWGDAIAIGRQINDEFPNSGIAREVRGKWDVLNTRAAEARGRTPTPAP